jgi:exopolysaccharide biosynthesis polyprenyl glycosylphosphotransferase
MLVVAVGGILFSISIVTPLFVASYGALAVATTVGARAALRAALLSVGRRGMTERRVLIVGTGPLARRYAREVGGDAEQGLSVVGFCDEDWSGIVDFHATGLRRVADPKNFRDFLRQEIVDEVVVAVPMSVLSRIEDAVLPACEEFGVTVRFLGAAFQDIPTLARRGSLSDDVLLTLYHGEVDGWEPIVKRLLDVVLGSALLVVLAPVFAAIAIGIKLDSPGPVSFAQVRVGRNKRLFRMYKFRTMQVDAEQEIVRLEHLNEADGPVFKIRDDPRVTRFGRWLRSTSVDELPQLVNIVLGQMSLVGPRPLPIRDAEGFRNDRQRRRFSVRPGLTGLWQVSGRSEVSFDEWMEMDQQYIDEWSLLLDLKILLRTVPEVIRRTGAY